VGAPALRRVNVLGWQTTFGEKGALPAAADLEMVEESEG
jgi:hypothetical protein